MKQLSTIACATAFASAWAPACAAEQATLQPPPAATPAIAESAPAAHEYVAVVTSTETEVVPAPFTGRLVSLAAFEGQRVKAGDVLAKFDARELALQIASLRSDERVAQSEAYEASAASRHAGDVLVAQRNLLIVNAAPPMAVKKAQSEYDAANARVGTASARAESIESKRHILERQLAQAVLVAPIAGVVMNVAPRTGEVAQQNAPLLRIYDPTKLVVRFAVPTAERARFHPGQAVQLRTDDDGRVFAATVKRLTTERPPIDFTAVEAALDSVSLAPDDVRVATSGHVRITTDAREESHERGTID